MKLHEQLKALYASKWKELCDVLQTVVCNEQTKVKPAYPFLLSLVQWENNRPTENWYTDAELKVMVFGQETNSWVGKDDDFGTPPSPIFSPDVSMEAVMSIYEDFYASYYAVNKVAQVISSELPIPAYRTSHPSARLPKGEMEARYRAIVNDFANIEK